MKEFAGLFTLCKHDGVDVPSPTTTTATATTRGRNEAMMVKTATRLALQRRSWSASVYITAPMTTTARIPGADYDDDGADDDDVADATDAFLETP